MNNLIPEDFTDSVKEIYTILQQEKRVGVLDLCKRLHLSESTVRRTFTQLENRNLIQRYHGGASILQASGPEFPVLQRKGKLVAEKLAIAKAAAAHVHAGDSIVLTGGSTVAVMAQFVKDIPDLTIVTDSLLVVNQLMYHENIRLIVLGGLLNVNEQCFEGVLTSNNMKTLRCSQVFLGIKGISADNGFLTDDLKQAEFYKTCAASCARLIILAAHDKFENNGILPLFSPGEPDLLITDSGVPDAIVERLRSNGCKIEIRLSC